MAGILAVGLLVLATPMATAAQDPERPVAADTIIPGIPEPPRSPRGAFFRSLVLPGWGQAWVGAPVRGGVYFAMEAGAVWMTLKSRQKLREARDLEKWLRDTGQLAPTQQFELTRAREDQVEDWLTLAIFLLFFAGADAWVAAHLADFDDAVGVRATPTGGLELQARFPFGRRR